MSIDDSRKLAEEKGLIIDNNYEIYNKILNLYKIGFEMLLDERLDLFRVDEIIDNSGLYFSPSKIYNEKHRDQGIKSNYIRCINSFYIEKLSNDDIDILKSKASVDKDILDVVSKTYIEILKKSGVKTVSYDPVTPERILENGTIVFELSYGKNSRELEKGEFIINMKKQRELLSTLSKNLEVKIKEEFNLPGKVFIEKIV